MARKKLLHLKSNVVNSNGTPKLPTSEQIEFGEIAVNYANGHETLAIKNSSGGVVSFSNDQILMDYVDSKTTPKQTTGDSTTDVMSQKAITTYLGQKLAISDFNTYSGAVDTLIGEKASQSNLNALNNVVTAHTANTTIHVTANDKTKWNSVDNKLNTSDFNTYSGNVNTTINGKVDKVSGKGLSTNDYTTAEKNKLGGIASGAQVNVIESVKVNGTALTVTSKAVDVTVPTKTSQITNDSNYVSDASYVHTDNNYTTAEKNKLSSIASGAEVNQNAFSNIKVGSTTIAADSKTDTLEISGGGIVTVTADATNDKITISASNAVTSVAGKTGAVTLGKSDVGLGNVDNTADASKTVKAATSAATADTAKAVALSGVTNAEDLKAIEALTGTSGLLKKTAANTWALDTNSYSTTAVAVTGATYNSTNKKIELKNAAGTVVSTVDATAFIKDGMVSNVEVKNVASSGTCLVITFNTDAGKDAINIPISQIFDANNYYTKADLTGSSTTVVVAKASSATTAASAGSVALSNVTGADDIKAIEALTGTSGLLKKTAANTWALDTTSYSSATQVNTALSNKVDKVSGKGLSTNDYTTDEKNKLAGIAAGAEVNVQSDWNATSGDAAILNKPTSFTPSAHNQASNTITTMAGYSKPTSTTAIATGDTLNAAIGKLEKALDGKSNAGHTHDGTYAKNAFGRVTVGSTNIDADTTGDTLTLSGSNVTLTPDATNDKLTIGITKSNVTTALGYTPPTTDTNYYATGLTVATAATTNTLTISGTNSAVKGSGVISAATTTAAGLMSADDKTKLNGIAAGAEVNVQSDWNATSGDALILNKPTIPAAVAVKGNAETNYRTGNVNITPANIGLGNVNNTADANKSVASAAKLTTARTLWGQNFDGTADVSGNMTGVGTISASGDISISNTTAVQKHFKVINSLSELWMGVNNNGETFLWTPSDNRLIFGTNNSHRVDILANGNVGIGTTAPSYKLDVSGDVSATNFRGNFIGYHDGDGKGHKLGYRHLDAGNWTDHILYLGYGAYEDGSTQTSNIRLYYSKFENNSWTRTEIAKTSSSGFEVVNGTFYANGNASIGGTLGVTGNATLTSINGVTVGSSPKFTDTDTKVTSVGNHYTPTATSTDTKSATASSTAELNWGSAVVTGVTLSGDAKGHITSVTVASGKLKTPVTGVTLASGTNNGTVKLTVNGSATDNIAVKGLGTAAYKAEGYFAGSGHTHTNMVTGSSLTANDIMVGNGSSAIKASGKSFETTLSTTSDTKIPTSKAIATYVTSQMTSVLTYKGTVNQNSDLPASHKVGDVWVVASANTYAGKACEVGDYIICKAAGTAASDADWDVINGENQVDNKSASLAAAGNSATLATVDGTNITVTTPSTWTGVAKTGTVTKVSTGAGLKGGDITSTGTVKCALSSETKSTLAATAMGSTASRQYAVGLDANGVLSVNVPWTDHTYTVNNGTFTVSGNGASVASTSANANANTGVNIKAGNNVTITTGTSEITIAASQPTVNNGTLAISGNSTSVATFTANQSGNSSLIITAGTNVTITPDATNHKITIAAKDTTYSTATTAATGLMSAEDKAKLNGIAAGAEVNVQSDWNATSGDAAILNKPTSFTPSAHNQASNTITSMAGYSKPTGTTAIATGDTLNAAIGKLEKALDGKQASGNYLTGITSAQVTTALGYTPYNSTNPNGYTSNNGTVTSITAGTGLQGGTITSSGTISLGMPTVHSATTYTSSNTFTSSEPIVYCLCKFSSALNSQVCPVSSLAEGQQCNVIYNNTGSTDYTVSFSTTYLGPEGGTSNTAHTETKLTVKKYGYGEVNFIKLGGTIFLRGV